MTYMGFSAASAACLNTHAWTFYIAYPTGREGLDGKSEVLQHAIWDV